MTGQVASESVGSEPPVRTPEWAVDVLLWQEIEADPQFADWLVQEAFAGDTPEGQPQRATARPWHLRPNQEHVRSGGETDLLVTVEYPGRRVRLHIENKITASWSGDQPDRYRNAVVDLPDEASVLVAPENWIRSHGDGVGYFDGTKTYEQIADWLDGRGDDDERRSWVAERIRDSARPRTVPRRDPAPDIDAWVAVFAAMAAELGLNPKPSGYTKTASASARDGRFIPDQTRLGGPGNPFLYYKITKPELGNSRVDLTWDGKPSQVLEALAEGVGAAAETASRELLWPKGRSEFYVRADGGEAFGGLNLVASVTDQEPEIRAMLAAAVDLRDWWNSVAPQLQEIQTESQR